MDKQTRIIGHEHIIYLCKKWEQSGRKQFAFPKLGWHFGKHSSEQRETFINFYLLWIKWDIKIQSIDL